MMTRNISLSVVIPVYNEEKIIRENILYLDRTLKTLCHDYEIIVVDDASSDRTYDLLRALSLEIPALRILRNATRGYFGLTLRKGLKAAAKELVLYTDADRPFEYSEIKPAIRLFFARHADLLKGFRINRKDEGPLRWLSTAVYNWFVRVLFRVRVRDVNFAFKLIKKSVLERLNLKAQGPFIDTEIVVKTAYLGYVIEKIGMKYCFDPHRKSRMFGIVTICLIFLEILKHRPELMALKKRKREKIINY